MTPGRPAPTPPLEPPLGRPALAHLGAVWRGSVLARAVLVALAAATALLVAVPVVPAAGRLMLGKFHLRGPFAVWALLQPVPSMYNFANVVRVEIPGAEPPVRVRWLNHYPLRTLTYLDRIALAQHPGTVLAESRYGRLRAVTRCWTTPRDGGVDVRCEAVQ